MELLHPSKPGRKDGRNWWSGGGSGQLRHGSSRHTGTSTADLGDHVVLSALALRSFTLTLPSACPIGIVGHKALVIVLPNEEVTAELPTFFRVSLQRLRAAISLAFGRARALFAGHLDDERSTFNRVDENEARLESSVRGPGTEESDRSAALVFVILWVYIEKACFTHACTCRILLDRGGVDNVQAVAVVGLVEEAIKNVLVVVNGAGPASVVSGVHGVLEIADIEDVSGWQTLSHRANFGVTLVEFVVHEEILLVHFVVDDTERKG